jgi:hypothetical protein
MPIEAGATYVFDLGYYDFAWWAQLDAQGCRLVTRFKKNTPLVDPAPCRSTRKRASYPIASASCPPVRPETAKIRCAMRCARSS